jgi:hypothetical protein
MPASVNVNELSVSAKFSNGFSRTAAEGGTTAAFGLLVVVALVLFTGASIYFNHLVGPTDLPFLGQFFGP